MIISSLSIPIDLIEDCLVDLQQKESKEDMLRNLTKQKLDMYNQDYIREFNQTVDQLYNYAINGNIKGVSVLINKLSKTLNNFYKVELRVFKALGVNKNDK